MKKLLACVLAVVLALGCGVGAAASFPSLDEWDGEVLLAAKAEELEAQSLSFVPVTGLEAQWNGEILLLPNGFPVFDPGNVEITLHFEEDEPVVLSAWSGSIGGARWEVECLIFLSPFRVMFYYQDADIRDAFLEENPRYAGYGFRNLLLFSGEYRAVLPQAGIDFPENYIARFIEAQKPMAELKLNESAAIPAGRGYVSAVSFTPARSGLYRIAAQEDQLRAVYDSNLQFVYRSFFKEADNGALSQFGANTYRLQAGETYYFLVRDYEGRDTGVTVASFRWLQAIVSWLQQLGIIVVLLLPILFPGWILQYIYYHII